MESVVAVAVVLTINIFVLAGGVGGCEQEPLPVHADEGARKQGGRVQVAEYFSRQMRAT